MIMKRNIRIAIVGYGVVGQGVYGIIEDNRKAIEKRIGASCEIAAICDLRKIPQKSLHVRDFRKVIERKDIDIVVELMGGYEPARTLILESIKSGKHIVTANKAVLAKHWDEIFTLARQYSRLVFFEASVCGAVPVIQVLNEGLAANRIEKISGILNGTTNYILSEMTREKLSFAAALLRAQKSGFAEADPSFDIEGIDTANKLAILSSLAWGGWVQLSDIRTRGITMVSSDDVYFAKKFGYVIKLLGTAINRSDWLELSVEPRLVPIKHSFAHVHKEYNAVVLQGDAAGDIMLSGKGAGQLAAASAVVSDIIFVARQVANGTAGRVPYVMNDPQKKPKILDSSECDGSYYLRFVTADKPGVLSKISGILGKYEVSIASVYQEEPLVKLRRGVPIIMLTHLTNLADLEEALEAIDELPIIKAKSVYYKIEN